MKKIILLVALIFGFGIVPFVPARSHAGLLGGAAFIEGKDTQAAVKKLEKRVTDLEAQVLELTKTVEYLKRVGLVPPKEVRDNGR